MSKPTHLSVSSKIIMRRTIPYFVALALACFVLHLSSKSIQYFPISYFPLALQSQNSTNSNQISLSSDLGNFASRTVDFLQRNRPVGPSNFAPLPGPEKLPSPIYEENSEEAQLDKVLCKAAMENKTVIVTTVNAAWTEPTSLLDLFLESFKVGNETQKFLKHLVVIALDQKAYNRCLEMHPYCYALKTEGIDFSAHEAYFMREDYVSLVWRKIEMVQIVLKMGYSILFTDADIMWFRDPFLHFIEDADLQTACDHYETPTSSRSNTGFYYVKSNNRTVQFYEFWLTSRGRFPGKHDQDVFNTIKSDPFIKKTGIKIRFLDTTFYGGFCEPSKDLNLVCTMHASCCFGLGKKLHDLGMLIWDWKTYMELPSDERARTPQNWTSPGIKCGWR